MTAELIKIISDLKMLFDDWTSKKIPNEAEFITALKTASIELTEELKKPQSEQKTV